MRVHLRLDFSGLTPILEKKVVLFGPVCNKNAGGKVRIELRVES
jgi:hypothetical protein